MKERAKKDRGNGMTNDEFARKMQVNLEQADRAVTRLAEQISEDNKRLNAKFEVLRSLQDRYLQGS